MNNIKLQTTHQSIPTTTHNPHDADKVRDPKLWQASLKFEAMLMQQMLSAMRKTVHEVGNEHNQFASQTYHTMMDQAVADRASQSGSLGIARAVYRQMEQLAQPQKSPQKKRD